jgi:hypothetical protein
LPPDLSLFFELMGCLLGSYIHWGWLRFQPLRAPGLVPA